LSSGSVSIREKVFLALKEILLKGGYSHLVLKDFSQGLSPRDKKLFWETTLGVLRWLERIDWGLSRQIKRYKRLPDDVKVCLRMGYYQLLFMDRIPPYSVVNETVEVAKKYLPVKYHKFTNAVLRKAVKLPFPVVKGIDGCEPYASVARSHPEWMVGRWRRWFGVKELVPLLNANNQPAPFTLWINRYFTTLSEVRKILREMGIECKPFELLPGEMLQLLSGVDIADTELYRDGLVTLQDVASAFVVKVLEPQPGEVILDACAAPGIKTAQIALAMKNEGRVIACEIKEDRFKLLLENVKRLGAAIVEGVNDDVVSYVSTVEDEFFDRILVDAPCSDLGTIRRRPELKWRRTVEDVLSFSSKQKRILDAVVPKLKVGGTLVYSVCSFEKEETFDIVERITKEYPLEAVDFKELLPDKIRDCCEDGKALFLPHKTMSDGFFIAKLRRRG